MTEDQPNHSTIGQSLNNLGRLVLGTIRNRSELFAVEVQEERYRMVEVLALLGIALVLGLLVLLLVTGVIVFLFPADYRIWAALGLAIIYSIGIVLLILQVKTRMAGEPFTETLTQIKKDWDCFAPRE